VVDPAGRVHLAKGARRRDEGLAHRDRRDDDIRRCPAGLLGDLVGERLLAILFVGVARGAAVEEEPLLDEPVPERDQIVVHALVDDQVRGRRRHVQQLRRRSALVREDQRAQARAGRVGRDRRARVARADDRRRAVAELERGTDRGGGGAVLDRAGRVGALELHEQPAHAEIPGQPRRVEKRRPALAERHAMGRVGDREDGRVAPEPRPREDRGPEGPHAVEVVGEFEEAVTPLALEPVGEGVGRAAVDAGEVPRERVGQARLPWRSASVASISSTRWRSVCSARARRRACSPIARASSGCAR